MWEEGMGRMKYGGRKMETSVLEQQLKKHNKEKEKINECVYTFFLSIQGK